MRRIRAAAPHDGASSGDRQLEPISLSLIGGVAALVAGFVAIWLAWRHMSRTDQLWIQSQELLSGGVGGLGLIILGVGLLIRDQLSRNQALAARQRTMFEAERGRVDHSESNSDVESEPQRGVARRRAVGVLSARPATEERPTTETSRGDGIPLAGNKTRSRRGI